MHKYWGEIKHQLKLAMPLVLAYMVAGGKSIVDTMMVGHIDKANLAGMALATSIFIVCYYLCLGPGIAMTAVFARQFAKKNYEGLKHSFYQLCYLNLTFAIAMSLFFLVTKLFLVKFNLEPTTIEIAYTYLKIMVLSMLVVGVYNSTKSLLRSVEKTKIFLWISCLTFILNIPLNYLFIYRLEMGAAGSAWAIGIYYIFSWFIVVFNGTFIPIFARLKGAEEYTLLKDHIHQTLYLNVILGFIGSLVLINSSFIFQFMNVEEQTKQIAQNYLSILGAFYVVISMANVFRVSLLAFLKNNVVFIVAVVSFILNILLNYIFIYKLELGAEGSAWATVSCHFLEFTLITYFLNKIKKLEIFNISKPNFKEMYILFKISIPSGIEVIFYVIIMSLIAFILASYGEVSVASHQILFSYFSLHVAFVTGFGTVMIQKGGTLLGQNNIEGIKELIFNTLGLVLFVTFIQSIITVVFASQIVDLYTNDMDIYKMTVAVMIIAPIFHLADNLRVVTRPPMRMFKKNKEGLYMSAPNYFIVVLLGGGFLSQYYGVLGIWIALSVSYIILNICQAILVYKLVWKGEHID